MSVFEIIFAKEICQKFSCLYLTDSIRILVLIIILLLIKSLHLNHIFHGIFHQANIVIFRNIHRLVHNTFHTKEVGRTGFRLGLLSKL